MYSAPVVHADLPLHDMGKAGLRQQQGGQQFEVHLTQSNHAGCLVALDYLTAQADCQKQHT